MGNGRQNGKTGGLVRYLFAWWVLLLYLPVAGTWLVFSLSVFKKCVTHPWIIVPIVLLLFFVGIQSDKLRPAVCKLMSVICVAVLTVPLAAMLWDAEIRDGWRTILWTLAALVTGTLALIYMEKEEYSLWAVTALAFFATWALAILWRLS